MAKGDKKKVKNYTSYFPKYISSDDDITFSDDDEPLPNELCKNPNDIIKGLMKQVRVRDDSRNNAEACIS
jgi:hypothetical protein